MYFSLSGSGIDIGILKQSHLEFQPQHALNGLIEYALFDSSVFNGINEIGETVSAQIDVNASL